MGTEGEADILEAQSGNTTGRTVSASCICNESYLTCAVSQLETSQYKPALSLIDTLLTELKRLDDKMILTEVHLLESRVYRGIGNLAKAKVRLSAVRRSV